MLPIITEEHSSLAFAEIFQDVHGWRKKMIHYIKEENPDVIINIVDATNIERNLIWQFKYLKKDSNFCQKPSNCNNFMV